MSEPVPDQKSEPRAEFDETPPQERVANFIDALVKAARDDISPRGRQRRDLACELMVGAGPLCNLFDDAPPEIRDRLFDLYLKSLLNTYGLGQYLVPDLPAKGQDAQRERALQKKVILTQAIQMYLAETSPKNAPHVVEQKPFNVTQDFAADIRPAILDALGLPEDAEYDVWPTLSAIKKALSAIKNGSF